MDRSEIIAQNIKAILDARNESTFHASLAAGLSRTAIDDFLRGRSKSLKVETLEMIASYLQVSIHALLDERSDDQLRQEIMDVVGDLDAQDKEKFLRIVHAIKGEK